MKTGAEARVVEPCAEAHEQPLEAKNVRKEPLRRFQREKNPAGSFISDFKFPDHEAINSRHFRPLRVQWLVLAATEANGLLYVHGN